MVANELVQWGQEKGPYARLRALGTGEGDGRFGAATSSRGSESRDEGISSEILHRGHPRELYMSNLWKIDDQICFPCSSSHSIGISNPQLGYGYGHARRPCAAWNGPAIRGQRRRSTVAAVPQVVSLLELGSLLELLDCLDTNTKPANSFSGRLAGAGATVTIALKTAAVPYRYLPGSASGTPVAGGPFSGHPSQTPCLGATLAGVCMSHHNGLQPMSTLRERPDE